MADTAFEDPVPTPAEPEVLADPHPHYAALSKNSPVLLTLPGHPALGETSYSTNLTLRCLDRFPVLPRPDP